MRGFLLIGLIFTVSVSPACAADARRVPPGAAEEGEYRFAEVIKATTGHQVIAFDETIAAHRELLERLEKVARRAAVRAKGRGIRRSRANEVGNAMEEYVLEAMAKENLDATRPRTQSGRTLSAGYPDFDLNSEPACYVELKTYNERTGNSTQRTFYYSPSTDPKITHDALHLLIAFQMVRTEEDGRFVWRPERYRIASLDQVEVKLKIEYNQGNRELYAGPNLLSDEAVE